MCLIAFAGKYFIYGIGLFTGSVDYEKHITFCQLYVFYMKKKTICARLEKTKYYSRGNAVYIKYM